MSQEIEEGRFTLNARALQAKIYPVTLTSQNNVSCPLPIMRQCIEVDRERDLILLTLDKKKTLR